MSVRMGIVKSKSGHYTLWCTRVSRTIGKLSLVAAQSIKIDLEQMWAGRTDVEKQALFIAEAKKYV